MLKNKIKKIDNFLSSSDLSELSNYARNLSMNEEHSDIKWFNIKDKNIHSYIQMKIQKYLNNKDIKYNCVI